jgi:hypothetical protein
MPHLASVSIIFTPRLGEMKPPAEGFLLDFSGPETQMQTHSTPGKRTHDQRRNRKAQVRRARLG